MFSACRTSNDKYNVSNFTEIFSYFVNSWARLFPVFRSQLEWSFGVLNNSYQNVTVMVLIMIVLKMFSLNLLLSRQY